MSKVGGSRPPALDAHSQLRFSSVSARIAAGLNKRPGGRVWLVLNSLAVSVIIRVPGETERSAAEERLRKG